MMRVAYEFLYYMSSARHKRSHMYDTRKQTSYASFNLFYHANVWCACHHQSDWFPAKAVTFYSEIRIFLPSGYLLPYPPCPSSNSEHTNWLLQHYPKLHDYSITLTHSSLLSLSSPPIPSSGSKYTYWLMLTPVQFYGPSFLWRNRFVTWCLKELTHISVSWGRLSGRKTKKEHVGFSNWGWLENTSS